MKIMLRICLLIVTVSIFSCQPPVTMAASDSLNSQSCSSAIGRRISNLQDNANESIEQMRPFCYAIGGDGVGGTGQMAHTTGGVGLPSTSGGDGLGGTGLTAGRVSRVDGTIMVRDVHGRQLLLGLGDAVCTGDRIEVGNGFAAFRFSDGGMLYARPGAKAQIENYIWEDAKPNKSESVITLLDGGVRVVSGQLGKMHPKGYLFKSSDADIRVLGTDFQVIKMTAPTDAVPEGTYVSVASGQVSLENSVGSILVNAGMSSMAKVGVAPVLLQEIPSFMSCQ